MVSLRLHITGTSERHKGDNEGGDGSAGKTTPAGGRGMSVASEKATFWVNV